MSSVAILIGNAKFKDPLLTNLSCPANDVTELATLLADPTRGGYSQVVSLIDEAHYVTIESIHETLQSLKRDDTLLFYYSGHGKLSSHSNDLYLTSANTNTKLLESSSIAIKQIYDLIKQSRCRTAMVMLDCCYSGAVGYAFKGSPEDNLNVISQGSGIALLTASSGIETAKEGDNGLSIFTQVMLEGIRTGEADSNNDGFITISELYNYISDKIRGLSPQTPTCWNFDQRGEIQVAKSGKSNRGERNELIEDHLYRLRKEGYIDLTLYRYFLDILHDDFCNLSKAQLDVESKLYQLVNKEMTLSEVIQTVSQLKESNAYTPPSAPIEENIAVQKEKEKQTIAQTANDIVSTSQEPENITSNGIEKTKAVEEAGNGNVRQPVNSEPNGEGSTKPISAASSPEDKHLSTKSKSLKRDLLLVSVFPLLMIKVFLYLDSSEILIDFTVITPLYLAYLATKLGKKWFLFVLLPLSTLSFDLTDDFGFYAVTQYCFFFVFLLYGRELIKSKATMVKVLISLSIISPFYLHFAFYLSDALEFNGFITIVLLLMGALALYYENLRNKHKTIVYYALPAMVTAFVLTSLVFHQEELLTFEGDYFELSASLSSLNVGLLVLLCLWTYCCYKNADMRSSGKTFLLHLSITFSFFLSASLSSEYSFTQTTLNDFFTFLQPINAAVAQEEVQQIVVTGSRLVSLDYLYIGAKETQLSLLLSFFLIGRMLPYVTKRYFLNKSSISFSMLIALYSFVLFLLYMLEEGTYVWSEFSFIENPLINVAIFLAVYCGIRYQRKLNYSAKIRAT